MNIKPGKTGKYFSKWRKKWIPFKKTPTPGEIYGLEKYNYKLILPNNISSKNTIC